MDTSVLQETQSSIVGEDSPPVLKEEVEANVQSLKAGKSPGVDNDMLPQSWKVEAKQ